jgi:hypothetical protein
MRGMLFFSKLILRVVRCGFMCKLHVVDAPVHSPYIEICCTLLSRGRSCTLYIASCFKIIMRHFGFKCIFYTEITDEVLEKRTLRF